MVQVDGAGMGRDGLLRRLQRHTISVYADDEEKVLITRSVLYKLYIARAQKETSPVNTLLFKGLTRYLAINDQAPCVQKCR